MKESGKIRWENWSERDRYSGIFSGEKHPRWNPDREQQAAKVKASLKHRRLVLKAVHEITRPVIDSLGYSSEELKKHLESQFLPGMSWENYGTGVGKWQIDHIVHLAKWSPDSDPKQVNALSNLRPMWEKENCRRQPK